MMGTNAKTGGHKSVVLRLLIIAVCLYLLMSVGTLYRELETKKAEYAELEAQIKESQLNVDEKNNLLQNGTDREFLEKVLRKNGYSYYNDKIFKNSD